jgi:hypothetical protein
VLTVSVLKRCAQSGQSIAGSFTTVLRGSIFQNRFLSHVVTFAAEETKPTIAQFEL